MSESAQWQVSDRGLPLIESWEQLQGAAELPPRIVWAEDRREMALIPAGAFIMGTTEADARQMVDEYEWSLPWAMAETPQRQETLPDFYLDVVPVTHDEYVRFLAANPDHPVPVVDEPGAEPYNWDEQSRRPPETLLDHPVVLVSWDDAHAYSRWVGKALPSEEQWEKGARGEDGRRYPWGDAWDQERLNCAERLTTSEMLKVSQWQEWWAENDTLLQSVRTTAVGEFPAGASPHGLLDMAGNVWEWCDSWYDAYPGSQAEHENFGRRFKVMRGGSWMGTRRNVRCAFRLRNPRETQLNNLGFRCASPPLQSGSR
ncbi:MAG: formylglycine-generating enzyme family protein [Actinobacteria bacterium]|nr:formylglycine-generating enzyme family protein [Actinomycetota bacterium]